MRTIMKRFGIFTGVAIVVFGLLPLCLPSSFEVERVGFVKGSANSLYNVVADFRTWEDWGYWQRFDQYAEWDVSKKYRKWSSNNKRVSEGRMIVVDSKKGDFLKWRVTLPNDGLEWFPELFFDEEGDSTRMTFRLGGDFEYFGRYRNLFYDFEGEIGYGFEASLADFKKYIELPDSIK